VGEIHLSEARILIFGCEALIDGDDEALASYWKTYSHRRRKTQIGFK